MIKYYEHMILGDYVHLASVSENSSYFKSISIKSIPKLLVIYVISQLPLKSFLTFARQLDLNHFIKKVL